MVPEKPRLTQKLPPDDSTISAGKWILFATVIILFLALTIVLVIKILRTTLDPLVNILTAVIATLATVTGILQFHYFRSPMNRSLEAIEKQLEFGLNVLRNTFHKLRYPTSRTGQFTRHIDWKFIWALLSTAIAVSLFFNLLPTFTRLIIAPATISCSNGQEINQEIGYNAQEESIGISNGCYVFSKNSDSSLASEESWDGQQAIADNFRQQDFTSAENFWDQRIKLDSSEAEARIYQEDRRVLAQYTSHITVVVPTMLTGDDASSTATGNEALQGAYIQQHQYNTSQDVEQKKSPPLYLLIANVGSQARFAETIAHQIVSLASIDDSVVGVMGWIFSTEETKQAATILDQAHIVSISPTISSDQFRGLSNYFFRIAPTDSDQGRFSARFARDVLKAHHAVVFVDYSNPYSHSLATGFSSAFKDDTDSTHQAYDVLYKRGELANDSQKAAALVDTVIKHYPQADLFFFAGYSNDFDFVRGRLLQSDLKDLPVMGGDGLYEEGGYRQTNPNNYQNITFTAFAYYDLWKTLHQPEPVFSQQYPDTFDPSHTSNAVDFNIAESDAILAYDALGLLLKASKNVYRPGQPPTTQREMLRTALTTFDYDHPYLGLSGQIGFSADGGPADKPILILCTTDGKQTALRGLHGHFMLGEGRYAILSPDSNQACIPNTNVQFGQVAQ